MVTFESRVMKVRTPEGTLFVNVMENENGEPHQVIINVGKAGSGLAAWAQALAIMITAALQSGTRFETILTELSQIRADGKARTIDSKVTSGPEGVWVALVRYRNAKFKELEESLGLEDEEEDASILSR